MDKNPTHEGIERKIKGFEKQAAEHKRTYETLLPKKEKPTLSNMTTENTYLVDGKYSIRDFIDIEKLRETLEDFCLATGFATALVEYPSQDILIATGWKDICTKFHRAFPESLKLCRKSNVYLTAQLKKLREVNIKPCENGLVDGATPIVIKGKHLASLFIGQVFFEKPDMERFKKQAEIYSYDFGAYSEALGKVPVVSENQFKNALSFLNKLALMIAETGVSNLDLNEKTRKLEEKIGERKQAEEALLKSEEKYRLLADNISDNIWILNLNTLSFSYVSPSVIGITGYSAEEATGLQLHNTLTPASMELATKTLSRELSEESRNPDPSRSQTLELEQYRKDGSTIWTEVSMRFILDAEGRPSSILGVTRNVSKRKHAEETLKDNEAFLQTLIDAIPTPIFYKDKDGKYRGFNRAFETFFGETKEQLIDKSVFDINPPELAEIYHTKDEELFNGGKLQSYESQWKNTHGKLCDFIFNKAVFSDSKGTVTGLIGVLTDITERKRAEKALRNSEQLLNEMGRLANIGGWEHDLLTREAVWTKETYRIIEIESGPVPGPDEHLNYYSAESQVLLDEAYRKAIETGEQFDLKLQCTTAKERQIWGRVIGRPEFIDGKCIKMKGTFQDITKQKQVEDALQESEEKFRNIADNSLVGVYIIQDGIFIYVNPKFADIFGYSIGECLDNMHFQKLVHPEDLDTVQEQVNKRVSGAAKSIHYTFRGIKKSGEIVHVEIFGSSIVLNGKVSATGTMLDITARKKLESQLQQSHKMEAIGTLAGGIAHDFNNILGIILGNSELAMDDVPEWNPARQNLDEIRKACLRAKDVVRQILSFSRKSETEQKPLNIAPVVIESLKLLRASIPTSIDIRKNISNDIDDILGDPTQIHQILMNLCANAAHAMEDEGGMLEVNLQNEELRKKNEALNLKPGRYVKLTVKDKGIGISPEVIDRVFDPYFTTKDVDKGTGLGLSVVHGIVNSHRGRISVESEIGKGTAFNILFPAVEREDKEEPKDHQKLPVGKERILFVDDEEPMVNLNRQRLERLGYSVIGKTDPLEALEFFRSNPDQIDLVITDMTMPKMTGDKLVQAILEIRPDTPIILCTGYSEKISKENAQELGIRKYIEKPIETETLARSVREVLDD